MSDHRTRSTEAGYDVSASEYADLTANPSAGARAFFGRFLDSLQPASTVVDLGCGPGADLAWLRTAGHHPVGIDRSTEMIRLAIGSGSIACRADLRHLPFTNGSVDAVWSTAALLHVERVDLASTLAEWARIVRPGGTVGLATSLGANDSDQGWELVPARPEKTPYVAGERERWFVHHHEADILAAATTAGWAVIDSATYESTRNWIQIIARA